MKQKRCPRPLCGDELLRIPDTDSWTCMGCDFQIDLIPPVQPKIGERVLMRDRVLNFAQIALVVLGLTIGSALALTPVAAPDGYAIVDDGPAEFILEEWRPEAVDFDMRHGVILIGDSAPACPLFELPLMIADPTDRLVWDGQCLSLTDEALYR